MESQERLLVKLQVGKKGIMNELLEEPLLPFQWAFPYAGADVEAIGTARDANEATETEKDADAMWGVMMGACQRYSGYSTSRSYYGHG